MRLIAKTIKKTLQRVAFVGWTILALHVGWKLHEVHVAVQPAINIYQRFEELGKVIPAWNGGH